MLTISTKLLIDVLIALVAFTGGWFLASSDGWPAGGAVAWALNALIFAGLIVAVQLPARVYRHSWRYVSPPDLLRIVQVALFATLGLALIDYFLLPSAMGPGEFYGFTWMLATGSMMLVRTAVRAVREQRLTELLLPLPVKDVHEGLPRMVLIGNPADVDATLREVVDRQDFGYVPAGIVLDDDSMMGQGIRGVRVLGSTRVLESIVDAQTDGGDSGFALVFTTPPASLTGLDRGAIARLRKRDVRILTLPRTAELSESDHRRFRLRKLRLEDLLSRAPVNLPLDPLRSGFRNRRVMVTGAGGTIGSELCRQAAALGCSELIMLDLAETPLFDIDREISERFTSVKRRALLRDIRDGRAIREAISATRPEVIFHAAALKHVSLMEDHPRQAVETNVLGTANVAKAAREFGVSQMVLISTDKAVEPVNIMGAAKRLAEGVIHKMAEDEPGSTRFGVVRFGNVLGSNGSVVPIFRSQIESGGPVTITHPDMERYFMTVPEAVQLVLHATIEAAKNGGEPAVYVLDMGEPVKIMDMAQRLIELCAPAGKESDIEIETIGLRPGEKLREDLVDEGEALLSVLDGLQKVKPNPNSRFSLKDVEALVAYSKSKSSVELSDRIHAEVRRIRTNSEISKQQ
ncbi:polysaccharide biosynthesis protein [Hyphobacterium sp. HN65]|uniref:Polysaccharide biosynthesis protein n=1 Tax=Hyphobacterium lacteum TaxID=3116575 RepID=A0ABU7LP09_9PROT|nr:polysaccharide biosynthesis protein [Hyphobacterium sp. HN65]MEE2525655.1 polysaccharide biosynthesis protein [Hyphobacterium sp. HN65]